MGTDELLHESPKKNGPMGILTYVAVAIVAFGAGMLLESQMAARTAAAAKTADEQALKQAVDKAQAAAAARAEEEKQAYEDSLAKERAENEKVIQTKDRNLAAANSRFAGVRHALEADLSAARTSGEACTARIAGISEALGGVFDSVGEVAGIAQDLGRENQQLKEDNKSLSDKLAGWQKWNSERTQRVTVTGKKS